MNPHISSTARRLYGGNLRRVNYQDTRCVLATLCKGVALLLRVKGVTGGTHSGG